MARLKKVIDNASANNNVKGALADGMYDSNKNFRYLSKNHIKPGIKTRSNSKVKTGNCQARNRSVMRQQTNLKRWKHSVSYGRRWMAERYLVYQKNVWRVCNCKKVSEYGQRDVVKSITV